jgi:scyllo-inositol 2-dehydrogenase (NADP+)
MPKPIRWAIIGSGNIAARFACDFTHVRGAELIGVLSRREAAAGEFAARFRLPETYATLEALLAADVQAVYLATPHTEHPVHALACLKAGIAVLSEKPAAPNLPTLEKVLTAADQHGVLYMEAMKSAFYPLYRRIKALLAEGAIGEVNFVNAGFAFIADDRSHSVFNPAQAGGSLLDVAIYAAFLACDLLGPPRQVKALLEIGPTGVDEMAALSCLHRGGMATLFSGLKSSSDGRAVIGGSAGHIVIEGKWWNPRRAQLVPAQGASSTLEADFIGGGLCYETQHFTDLLHAGQRRSEILSFELSRAMIQTLDMARADAGLRFPFEVE